MLISISLFIIVFVNLLKYRLVYICTKCIRTKNSHRLWVIAPIRISPGLLTFSFHKDSGTVQADRASMLSAIALHSSFRTMMKLWELLGVASYWLNEAINALIKGWMFAEVELKISLRLIAADQVHY